MGSFSNYAEDKVLDHIIGETLFSLPTVWIGLSTADPLDDASGNSEPGAGNYGRVAVAGDWAAASGGSVENDATITFPTATAGWGTVSHFALWDAETVGNMLLHGSLGTSKPVVTDDVVKFLSAALVITLD